MKWATRWRWRSHAGCGDERLPMDDFNHPLVPEETTLKFGLMLPEVEAFIAAANNTNRCRLALERAERRGRKSLELLRQDLAFAIEAEAVARAAWMGTYK